MSGRWFAALAIALAWCGRDGARGQQRLAAPQALAAGPMPVSVPVGVATPGNAGAGLIHSGRQWIAADQVWRLAGAGQIQNAWLIHAGTTLARFYPAPSGGGSRGLLRLTFAHAFFTAFAPGTAPCARCGAWPGRCSGCHRAPAWAQGGPVDRARDALWWSTTWASTPGVAK